MANGPEKHNAESPLKSIKESVDKIYNLFTGQRESLSSKTAEGLSEKKEAKENFFSHFHDSGKFEIFDDAGKYPKLAESQTYVFEGKVDRTAFQKRDRSKDMVKELESGAMVSRNWYESINSGAMVLAQLMDENRVTIDFPSLKDKNSPAYKKMQKMLIALTSMTDFSQKGFKETLKGFSDKEIYGSEGVCQLILAFKRATATVDISRLIEKKEFMSTEQNPVPNFLEIRLKIADKPQSGSDRYSLLINTEKVKAAPKPTPAPTPAPKPTPAPTPAPKPTPAPTPAPKPTPAPTPAPKPTPAPTPAPKPTPAPTPAPKPLETKESPNSAAAMAEALRKNGFTFLRVPNDFTSVGKAAYGQHRLNISFNQNGTYNYELATLPTGRSAVKVNASALPDMKANLDSQKFADPIMARAFDLQYSVVRDPENPNKISPISLKNVSGQNINIGGKQFTTEPNTFEVTVSNFRFQNKEGKIFGPVNVTFYAVLSEVVYEGFLTTGEQLTNSNKDVHKFAQSAAKEAAMAQASE